MINVFFGYFSAYGVRRSRYEESEDVFRAYKSLSTELDAYRSAATLIDLDIDLMVRSVSQHYIRMAHGGVARQRRLTNAINGAAAFLISTGGYLREYDR